jgi:hypothetical protein
MLEPGLAVQAVDRQRVLDEEHLRLLSIAHYIAAVFNAFGALMGFGYGMFFSAMMRSFPNSTSSGFSGGFDPGLLFGLFGGLFGVAMLLGAAAEYWVGRNLARREGHTYCVVVSALGCLSVPYGTILGVASLMVLERATVRALFARR